MNIQNNKIVIDLNKVQWASFYYKNQYGQCSQTKPKKPTYRSEPVDPTAKRFHTGENLLEWASKEGILDVWIPQCKLQLTANHNCLFTGPKAQSIWKEWNRRIFKKKGN